MPFTAVWSSAVVYHCRRAIRKKVVTISRGAGFLIHVIEDSFSGSIIIALEGLSHIYKFIHYVVLCKHSQYFSTSSLR